MAANLESRSPTNPKLFLGEGIISFTAGSAPVNYVIAAIFVGTGGNMEVYTTPDGGTTAVAKNLANGQYFYGPIYGVKSGANTTVSDLLAYSG